MMVVVSMVVLTGCKKDRQCRCFYTDGSEDLRLKVFFVDPSIRCEDLTEMAIEEKVTEITPDDTTHTLHRNENHTMMCRDFHGND